MCLRFILRPAPTGARNRGYRRWFRQEPVAYPGGIGYPLEACRIFSTRSGLCPATEPFYCIMRAFPKFCGCHRPKAVFIGESHYKARLFSPLPDRRHSLMDETVGIIQPRNFCGIFIRKAGGSCPGIFSSFISISPSVKCSIGLAENSIKCKMLP